MDKIFSILRAFLARLAEPVCTPDPLDGLSQMQLADLPAMHPRSEA